MNPPIPDIVDEFRVALNDAAAVFGVAQSGLPIVSRELAKFASITDMKPADLIHLATVSETCKGGPNDAFAALPFGQLPTALAPDGAIARQIGHQWVVHVYHLWEGHYREEIARARGLNNMNELQNPHFGDLAKIRHDILKHRGLASRKNAARCVNLRWVEEGEAILIQDWMVYEFMEAFGLVYPASGQPDPRKVQYHFHGMFDSPIKLVAVEGSDDKLFGEVRAQSGRPVDVDMLRQFFCGAQFTLAGPGGEGTAIGLEVEPDSINDKVATVVARAPTEFVRRVRLGDATAQLPLGSAIPQKGARRAVPVKWLQGNTVVAQAVAPEGRWYDDTVYRQQIGEWLPLVSDIGNLHEGMLVNVTYEGQGRRELQLHLEVSAELASAVKGKTRILRAPLALGDA